MHPEPIPPLGQLKLSLGVAPKILQVSELNASVQDLFSSSFRSISVAGEVSSCRLATSGHYYFSLKDSGSQVKSVLFKGAARLIRVKPQDGLSIVVHGSLEVYQARGEYQLIAERIELQGAGSLQAAFEQLKQRLAVEGLFEQSRKRTLPRFPRRIGLITSSSGAVFHDILQILARRFPGLHIRLFPAQVQGEGSVDQMIAALRHFEKSDWAEVVILARGGGSLEDLWSFNDERLARAMAAFSKPLISAVGHETDFTIADFVADLRAPTPSAAAEIVVCTRESLLLQISACSLRVGRALRYRLMAMARAVDAISAERGVSILRRTLMHRMQQIDENDQQMQKVQVRQIGILRRRLDELDRRLQEANLPLRFSRNRHRQEVLTAQLARNWRALYTQSRRRLDVCNSQLIQLSPLDVLSRGYAIVEKPSGEIIRSSLQAEVDQHVRIRLAKGGLQAIISATELL